jgi:1-phosphatidylinositol-4-phosphate 5-kinase
MVKGLLFWLSLIPTHGAINPAFIISKGIDALGTHSSSREGLLLSERSVTMSLSSEDFTIAEKLPSMFMEIRRLSKIHQKHYQRSLTEGSLLSFVSNSLGSQRNKVVFFWSSDRRYMVKSLTDAEVAQLLQMLPDYLAHLRENPGTLLTRFCGLYSVHPADAGQTQRRGRPLHFVVMQSAFPSERSLQRRYDLKGSTVGRRTLKEAELTPISSSDTTAAVGAASAAAAGVLKDLDFLALEGPAGIALGPQRRAELLALVAADVAFLEAQGVMDYSLLVGVHHRRTHRHVTHPLRVLALALVRPIRCVSRALAGRASCRPPRPPVLQRLTRIGGQGGGGGGGGGFMGGWLAADGTAEYHLGIIDFLQAYNSRKWAETQVKSLANGGRSRISSVPPALYGARFLGFLGAAVFPYPS